MPATSTMQQSPRRRRRPRPRVIHRPSIAYFYLFCMLLLLLSTSAHAFTSPNKYVKLKVDSGASFEASSQRQLRAIKRGQIIGYNRLPMILHAEMAAILDEDPDKHKKQSKSAPSTTFSSSSSSSSATPFVGLPSYRRISLFVATTFLVWVSEPLLSLVDSAAVGRYAGKSLPSTTAAIGNPDVSSVVQLAALGPATMLCDSSIYLTLFVAMATTNKLARAFAKSDLEDQIRTVSHVLGVSLALGALLLLLINLRGERMLAAIIGPAGATISVAGARGAARPVDLTPEVLRASMGYATIRSVVSPLAVMGLTSQSALLCAQDTKTPALAVLVASVVNIVGDYLFVARMRWGVRGAALATSLASLAANGMLVGKVWGMVGRWKEAWRENHVLVENGEWPGRRPQRTKQSTSDTNQPEYEREDPTGIPFISLPDRESLVDLLLLAGPMFFVMLGKVMGYSAMTIRAGNFGMVSLACHNVLMRIFFFFATVGDALSQSAQTFLPGLFYQKSLREESAVDGAAISTSMTDATKDSRDGDNNARTFLKRLFLLSSISGIVSCILGRCIAHNSGSTFTTDSALVSLMSRVSPFMGLGLLLHPLTMALEGSIIAANDAGYLVGTYVASLAVLLVQLRFACKDFLGVWHAILLFQIIRITQFGARVWKRTSSSRIKERG